MTTLHKFWYLLLSYALLCCTNAQSQIGLKQITIGQRCPDVELGNIVNYSKTAVRLSDFKGKLMILDFWASWCGACLESFPKLNALQKKFGDKLIILPITYEKTGFIKEFILKSKIWKSLQLPSVTEDSTLHRLFKHSSIPHEIWVDSNSTIIGITDAEQITSENIQHYLDGDILQLNSKKDILDYDLAKPLLLGALGSYNFNESKLKYSSILSQYIEGMPGAISPPTVNGNLIKISAINVSIDNIFYAAFALKQKPYQLENNPDFYLFFPSRKIWEAKDSFLYPHWPDGINKQRFEETLSSQKYFCYEMILPVSDSLKINLYAQTEVNRYFGSLYGIEGIVEKRRVKCWSLVRVSKEDLIQTKGGSKQMEIDEDNDTISLRNCTITEFMFWWLNRLMYSYPIPIIDDTGYTGGIDLTIKSNLKDIKSLNKSLEKYGLAFMLTEKELSMIVIRNKSK